MTAFNSCYVLMDDARENIKVLKHQLQEYAKSQPFEFSGEEAPGGLTICRARLKGPIPSQFSVLVKSILSNIRAALDHAGYITAKSISGEREPKRTHFPFSKTQDNFQNVVNRKSADIPPDILRVMEWFEPWSNADQGDLLYTLSNARNIGEHQKLLPFAALAGETTIRLKTETERVHHLNSIGEGPYHLPVVYKIEWNEAGYFDLCLIDQRVTSILGIEARFMLTLSGVSQAKSMPVDYFLEEVWRIATTILIAIHIESDRLKLFESQPDGEKP